MSKFEKLLKRFKAKPKDFTFDELTKLLAGFGYEKIRKGKTAGSRVSFINRDLNHMIMLHKPHPKSILKLYVINYVLDELDKVELL